VALSQTYTNIEVVISDDCSPDNTPEVVAEFRGDPRVRYERGGVNVGRVKNYRKSLYELSSGSYVTNLDGDDLLGDVDYLRTAVGGWSGETTRTSVSGAWCEPTPLPT
jgi:glycosyltransferase involved in cell wall biosynthesis